MSFYSAFRGTGLMASLVLAGLTIQLPAAARGKASKAAAKPAAQEEPKPAPAPEPEPEPEATPEEESVPVETAPTETSASASTSTAATASPPDSAATGEPWSAKKMSVFVEGGIRMDRGNFSTVDRVGSNSQQDNTPIAALDGIFHAGLLLRANEYLQVGPALGYAGNYDITNSDPERDDALVLGQLLTLDFRGEFGVKLSETVSLLGSPRAGAVVLIPGGALQDRITQLQSSGYDTWGGPRFGFLLGADVGARYHFTEWLAARASVGYSFHMLFLLDSVAQGQSVSGSVQWKAEASRFAGNLGLEASF